MRQTSAESYRTIEREGLLGQLQLDVYGALFEHGPLTQGECFSMHFPYRMQHSITPRFAELERKGLFTVVGERQCRVSGMITSVWDVTADLPRKESIHRKKSRKQIIADLEREIESLKRGIEMLL